MLVVPKAHTNGIVDLWPGESTAVYSPWEWILPVPCGGQCRLRASIFGLPVERRRIGPILVTISGKGGCRGKSTLRFQGRTDTRQAADL